MPLVRTLVICHLAVPDTPPPLDFFHKTEPGVRELTVPDKAWENSESQVSMENQTGSDFTPPKKVSWCGAGLASPPCAVYTSKYIFSIRSGIEMSVWTGNKEQEKSMHSPV